MIQQLRCCTSPVSGAFLLFLGVSVLVLLPPNCVHGQTRRLQSAILVDLRKTNLTEELLDAAIAAYTSRIGDASVSSVDVSTQYEVKPVVLNSGGNLLTALRELEQFLEGIQTGLDVLFLAESIDVSIGVSDALENNPATADILVISVRASHPRLCDTSLKPATVCAVPWDSTNVRGVLETALSALEWHSVAVVLSSDTYGKGIASILENQYSFDRLTPRIVTQLYIKPGSTEEADNDLIREVLRYHTAGILCFTGKEELLRLRAAITRLGEEKNLFLLSSREAMNALDESTGSTDQLPMKLWGAFFVSYHTSALGLVKKGFFEPQQIDDYGAYIVSHIFDAIQAVSVAGKSPVAVRELSFSGFTGTVVFDSVTGERVNVLFSLISKSYTIESPLVKWELTSSAEEGVIMIPNAAATSSLILSSPLWAVTVCMAALDSCFEIQSLNAMSYVFLRHNQLAAERGDKMMFIPLVMKTGAGGVNGLVSLIHVARACSVFLGPGSGRLSVALEPVINQFGITQLDFNSADMLLSDPLAHPYFSRTIPNDMYNSLIYGELCAFFAWERVLIVSLNDPFGSGRAHAVQSSLEQRNIHVERVYLLPNVSTEQITSTMETIYRRDISRIVLVLLPINGDDAQVWFSVFDGMNYMKQYVFFLSVELCQYSLSNPEKRNRIQSSLCVFPYVSKDRVDGINNEANMSGLFNDQMQILSQGGFTTKIEQCALKTVGHEVGFAVDAAYTVIDSAKRAVASGVNLNRSKNFIPFIRSTNIDAFTGPFKIDGSGNRDFATFGVDIQVPNHTVFLGVWDVKKMPQFHYMATEPILWMTGETDVPADTFRDIQFILGTTVTASPGTIVLSLLGFAGTIAVFAFCYRHYKMQKLVEHVLASNSVPVTDEELRRLRGDHLVENRI